MKRLVTFLFIFLFSIGLKAQNLYFPPTTGSTWDTISPQSLNWCQDNIDSLYNFLESQNTKSFILLKDGKIVLEKYFGTHTQSSLWYWASAAKSLTAFMVGLAQQDNYLSINDTTSKYLGQGWTACNLLQENKITIKHQLKMTSGLDDGVPDHYCTLDSCLIYKADAGTRWAYHNGPYTLLDSVLVSATGKSLNLYLIQKLKNTTGIIGSFVKVDYNNVFYSNARSMARYGLLILNKGNWNGNQIMTDTAYFRQMTNTSQNLNKSYGYLWWLNGKQSFMVPQSQFVFNGSISPDAPSDMFAAIGKNGQLINIVPSKNMVWIRMGDAPDNSEVSFITNNDIWKYINKLECNNNSISNSNIFHNSIEIFPNPAKEFVNICAEQFITSIDVIDYYGKLIKSEKLNGKKNKIFISDLNSGFYFVKIKLDNGVVVNRKLIVK